ncbi:MAG: BRCT domain-containing protein [Nitrospinae bacterium]|nr:BRCT domain-containing protein [Nitrospinota bacterium]
MEIVEDGVIDDDERTELFELLNQTVGEPHTHPGESLSSTLPLDHPAPEVLHDKRIFCFTGRFAFGARNKVEGEAISRGGAIKTSPTQKTDYLVIGTFASREWMHTSYGRKIEQAVELKKKGHAIAIVGEEHWAQSLL